MAKAAEWNRALDHQETDNKMRHFPNWRSPKEEKFCGAEDFLKHQPKFSLDSKKSAWQPTPMVEHDKYIEGYEKLGNDLSLRQREKSKETGKGNFKTHTRADLWAST